MSELKKRLARTAVKGNAKTFWYAFLEVNRVYGEAGIYKPRKYRLGVALHVYFTWTHKGQYEYLARIPELRYPHQHPSIRRLCIKKISKIRIETILANAQLLTDTAIQMNRYKDFNERVRAVERARSVCISKE